jgi:ribosome-associated heat shock protein Hsp15
VRLRSGPVVRTVHVLAISAVRGPAPVAQALYAETPDSLAARERAAEQHRLAPEPALAQVQGRPTKRDRRQLQHLNPGPVPWDDRWSASIPP